MAAPEPFSLYGGPARLINYHNAMRMGGVNGYEMKAVMLSGKFPKPVTRHGRRCGWDRAAVRTFWEEYWERRRRSG
jgi:hypothetical protein